jgi:hypothetical protein
MFYQIVALVLYDDEQRELIRQLKDSKARISYPELKAMMHKDK